MKYPLRHVSIRVPWHDLGWDGPRGTLVITRDEPNGSIDSSKITRLIKEVLDA